MAHIRKATGLIDWLDQRLAVKKLMNVLMVEYWIPKQINFLWAMGVILTVLFTILFVTGLLLVMYYKPDTALAFDSVNKTIMQEVEYGWLWRHMHGVAASVIFLIIYIHMLTGIYYGSYKRGREMIWISGMLLFVVFSAEAFSGYMLPWGQMSYWAAQVITNLFGGVPFIGDELVIWIRGDYAVSDPTLTRFFMLHVCLLPIVIIMIIVFHFYSLRIPHVNNEIAEELDFDLEAEKYKSGDTKGSKVIPFWPAFLSGFFFDIGGLKAFDIGLIAFGVAQVIFFLLPWLDRSDVVKPAHARPKFFIWFWVLLIDLIVLTVYGKLPPTGINAWIGFVASVVFLALLLIILPLITRKEKDAQ